MGLIRYNEMRRIVSVFLGLLIVFSSFGVVTAGSDDKINKQTSPLSEADRVLGDINADSLVDINDAVALFRHIMLPEMYPVDYPGILDFDKNDLVDINDALRLFRHSMFPEQYPIEWGTEPIESVLVKDLKSYTIIYPEESSNELQRAGFMLRNKLTPKAGRQLKLKSDVASTEVSEYEVVLGKCDRDC